MNDQPVQTAVMREKTWSELFFGPRFANGVLSENNLPLEDFPSLFSMEGHTGSFGLALTIGWIGAARYYFPQIWSGWYLTVVMALVCVAFGILAWLSFILSGHFTTKIFSQNVAANPNNDSRSKLERRVRRWMTFLSTAYVAVSCGLIWATGGAASPFITFYVMIFALTIPSIKVPVPGLVVLAYYLTAIMFACAAPAIWLPPIASVDMKLIQDSRFELVTFLVFICASLVAPTLSTYWTQRDQAKRLASSGAVI